MIVHGEKTGNRERKVFRMNQDAELESFKREIDLRQFAVGLGYRIDRRESWRGSTVMRRGPDKIVVKRNVNGHYVFFSLRDDGDHGTLIDFLQRRQPLSLGAVRRILRPWLGHPAASPHFPELATASPNRMRVEGAYRSMVSAQRFPYLEQERCVPAAVLLSPRFADRMRIDSLGNTVFPHFDATGLCGYEIKSRGFTGFAAGGQKGLWFSHTQPGDRRLVLAESAIDALSYAALFPDEEDQTRYASLGGNPSSRQMALIQAAITKLPAGAEMVAAFDADDAGRKLVEVTRGAVAIVAGSTGRSELIFKARLPARDGEDWNQVLQKTAAARASPRRTSRV
jgi:hypothetical protein